MCGIEEGRDWLIIAMVGNNIRKSQPDTTFLKSCQTDGILVSFSQFIQRLRMSLVRYMLAVWSSILILRQKNSCKIICVIFICGWRGASSIIFMGHCEQWHIWLESFLFFSSHLSLFPLQSRSRTPQYPRRRRRRQPPASVQTRDLQYLHRCTLHFA